MNVASVRSSVAEYQRLPRRAGIERLAAVLAQEPALSLFHNHMQYLAPGWSGVTIPRLAEWLLKRADKVGVEQAVDGLVRYLSSEQVPCIDVMPLGGIQVDERVNLARDVALIPFNELPDSGMKESMLQRFGRSVPPLRPGACLVAERTYSRVHIPQGQSYEPGTDKIARYSDLEDARLLVGLIGPSKPVKIGSWTDVESWVPRPGAYGGSFSDSTTITQSLMRPQKEDWSQATALHEHWVKLSTREQRHLRVAMHRLNAAMLQPSTMEAWVDAAIDLGIAVEATFLADREPDRGELSFTLRLRAARFLGTDQNHRRSLAKFFRALYALRSSAVHTGQIPDQVEGMKAGLILRQGYELTALSLRRIILDGEPDWQAVIYE